MFIKMVNGDAIDACFGSIFLLMKLISLGSLGVPFKLLPKIWNIIQDI